MTFSKGVRLGSRAFREKSAKRIQLPRVVMIILTKELIERGKSSNGGWNKRQLAIFGLSYPLDRGWINRLVGREVTDKRYADFLHYKDTHIKRKKGKAKVIHKEVKQQVFGVLNGNHIEYGVWAKTKEEAIDILLKTNPNNFEYVY